MSVLPVFMPASRREESTLFRSPAFSAALAKPVPEAMLRKADGDGVGAEAVGKAALYHFHGLVHVQSAGNAQGQQGHEKRGVELAPHGLFIEPGTGRA
jgi:hypothetical protein